jgi:hypothetical protein
LQARTSMRVASDAALLTAPPRLQQQAEAKPPATPTGTGPKTATPSPSANRYDLDELLARIRPVLVGWARYYGLFHPSSLQRALKPLDHDLVRWAQRKYKKLRGRFMRAWDWLRALRQRAPTLFPHWSVAIMTTER